MLIVEVYDDIVLILNFGTENIARVLLRHWFNGGSLQCCSSSEISSEDQVCENTGYYCMFCDTALAVLSCLGRLCTFLCRNTHVPHPPCPAPIQARPAIPAQHSRPAPAKRSCTCNRIFPSVPFFFGTYRIFHSLDGTREKIGTKGENSRAA